MIEDNVSRFESQTCLSTHFVAEERPGDVDLLAPHNDDLLAGEDLFGNNGRQSSQEMALSIDDDGA